MEPRSLQSSCNGCSTSGHSKKYTKFPAARNKEPNLKLNWRFIWTRQSRPPFPAAQFGLKILATKIDQKQLVIGSILKIKDAKMVLTTLVAFVPRTFRTGEATTGEICKNCPLTLSPTLTTMADVFFLMKVSFCCAAATSAPSIYSSMGRTQFKPTFRSKFRRRCLVLRCFFNSFFAWRLNFPVSWCPLLD